MRQGGAAWQIRSRTIFEQSFHCTNITRRILLKNACSPTPEKTKGSPKAAFRRRIKVPIRPERRLRLQPEPGRDAAGKELTIQTLPQIIEYFKNQGYTFGVLE